LKAKKLFMTLLGLLLLLIGIGIRWTIQENHEVSIKHFLPEMVLPQEEPIKRSVSEAEEDLNLLLRYAPLEFDVNGSLLEGNETENQYRLPMLVDIFHRINEEVAVIIAVHSEVTGAYREHRIHTQAQADALLRYLQAHYQPLYMDATGYGEEFPIVSAEDATHGPLQNARIEIHLYAFPLEENASMQEDNSSERHPPMTMKLFSGKAKS